MRIKYSLYIGFICFSGLGQVSAYAEVYKCPGPSGSITLSNVEKGAGCKKMVLPPVSRPAKKTAQPVNTELPTAATKPVEKPKSSYDSAAAERKRIIQEEIDLERSRLNGVQARIKELAPIANKTPDQVKEQVALQHKESLHASNIQLLQKELNR